MVDVVIGYRVLYKNGRFKTRFFSEVRDIEQISKNSLQLMVVSKHTLISKLRKHIGGLC